MPLQQHINLSSPVSQTPCFFNLNVYILTPKSKKPLMHGNQQLKSQAISHLMINAVPSKIPSFPQASYPATSPAGTTSPSFSPREAGSDLKALLPQPPTPSSALASPIPAQAAQPCILPCAGDSEEVHSKHPAGAQVYPYAVLVACITI